MSESRDKTINIRVSETEKNAMNKLAESAGLDLSTLIRNAVLTDGKLVFLQEGAAIAKGICSLIKEIHTAADKGIIDKKYCTVILSSLEELVGAFNTLASKLPDICNDTETEGEI